MNIKEASLVKLGKNIRRIRESKGLSQEDLALEAGLDRTYVGGVERGERNPTITSALKIAKALNTTLSVITEGVGND
ncbi:helix-turn-helix transcriptional regulator [Oceaniferula spumae]|uniref:helix-turn-helix transcriptional regulator n=1 Tax=Oceaniferula spumae TaxID=2979115 RepID=UPI003F4EA6A9